MKKAVAQQQQTQEQSSTRQVGGVALASPQNQKIAQLQTLVESGAASAMQHELAAKIGLSPVMVAQRKFIEGIDNSPYAVAQRQRSGNLFGATQRVEDKQLLQGKPAAHSTKQLQPQSAVKFNNTGLPDQLKTGIESLSGISMDHVKVHYNSAQPAQLNALAYAQGSDIHVASGQEQHLPHEAWHVVQQAQGRVKPTMQMKEGVPVNDDKGLEHEADVMGAKAMATGQQATVSLPSLAQIGRSAPLPALQRVKNKELKKELAEEGHELSVVDKWQKQVKLSDLEIKSLLSGALLDTAMEASAEDLTTHKEDLIGWLRVEKSNAERASQPTVVAAKPRTIVDDLEDAGLSTLYGDILAGRETKADIKLFLKSAPADMLEILKCAASGANRLQAVQDLLLTNAGKYPVPTVLGWASTHGTTVTDAALVATAHENIADYVKNWLSYGVTAASGIQVRQLVRFQALLNGGAQLVRQKADKRYQGTDVKRTGFLKYQFNDGTRLQIHTHWNVKDKKIYSMHVQDLAGDNGIEINSWQWFADVAAEVVAGQNRSTPTTDPVGGALT